jgi:hypothetical protein
MTSLDFCLGDNICFKEHIGVCAFIGDQYIVIEIDNARLCVYPRDWKHITLSS